MELLDKIMDNGDFVNVEKYLLDNKDNIKIPYDTMWFDYVYASDKNSLKIGLLIQRINEGYIGIHCFAHLFGHWNPQPRVIAINFDKNIIGITTIENAEKIIDDDSEQYRLLCHSLGNATIAFANFILFLNCKNIGTKTVHLPVKLNNKRKKKGKLPIFSYKTLVITNLDGTPKKGLSLDKWHNRIHMARGHFKTYTAEHPLLGKHVGRFWWNAHVRGKNKDGVVMKDYEVKP